MKEILKVDLRIARQRSGLSIADVVHLLGINRVRLSKLENGHARPRVRELIGLSLLYGNSITELFRLSASRLTAKLSDRLESLEPSMDSEDENFPRHQTLMQLTDLLTSLNQKGYVE